MLNLQGLNGEWKTILDEEFQSPYFEDLTRFVQDEYRQANCFPPPEQIYAAFDFCAFDNVKVVMIGQDPYHGAGQANGLCFSVNEGIAHPPSLANIFKELEADIGKPVSQSGNLAQWARQGILMLNATLTVRESKAGSHQKKGWEKFTDAVIREVSARKHNVVFLLWGGYAKKKGAKIDQSKHHVLTCGHPSPLSANQGYWFGNKHFSQANAYLQSNNSIPIAW